MPGSEKMEKACIIYERKCIQCGECDMCNLDPKIKCTSCGKCLETEKEFRSINIKKFFQKEED